MARSVANVLDAILHILEIQKLTMPRVALARSRVELGIYLLLLSLSGAVNSHRATPVLGEHDPVPELLFCYFLGVDMGGGSTSLVNPYLFHFMLVFAVFLFLLFF
ncbi:hypothetical protein Hanom_Chr17g01576761 [Helianthus anomalus]